MHKASMAVVLSLAPLFVAACDEPSQLKGGATTAATARSQVGFSYAAVGLRFSSIEKLPKMIKHGSSDGHAIEYAVVSRPDPGRIVFRVILHAFAVKKNKAPPGPGIDPMIMWRGSYLNDAAPPKETPTRKIMGKQRSGQLNRGSAPKPWATEAYLLDGPSGKRWFLGFRYEDEIGPERGAALIDSICGSLDVLQSAKR